MIKLIVYLTKFAPVDRFINELLYLYSKKINARKELANSFKLIQEKKAQVELVKIVKLEKEGKFECLNIIPMPKRRGK